jgi:glycosyltransferase involved in cell wall biosynthesis
LAAEKFLNSSRTMPKVSICLPNLNTAKYLPERLDSILSQTFKDWELIVYDSYSGDGAWEIFQSYAAKDSRMQISQGPREGIYAGFNACISKAQGEFIYIATSDDTMSPNCLEKMVAALEKHPDCGLCQCALEIIDDSGKIHTSLRWEQFAFGRFALDLLRKQHIRPAPMDGILHFALQTIFTSITQLLVRRCVFDRYGLFDCAWGSAGDFEWGTRVGLLVGTIYLPDSLATWRVHPSQATGFTETAAMRRKMSAMADSAYQKVLKIKPDLRGRLPALHELRAFYDAQILDFIHRECQGRRSWFTGLLREAIRGNRTAWRCLISPKRTFYDNENEQFSRLSACLEKVGCAISVVKLK